MKTSTELTTSHSTAVLLVGEPKTGKTGVMLAFPDPWINDIDMNLAGQLRRLPAGSKKFWFDQPALKDGKERPMVERWPEVVKVTKEAILEPQVKSICVDGLGMMCEWLIAYIVDQNIKAGTCKTGKMELQMYGELARLLRGYIMLLRTSGKYVVVTSHQTADKDDLTGAMRYALAIPGQSKDTLGGLFTDCWATTAMSQPANKVKYEIRTKPTGFHVALGTSFSLDAAIDVTDKSPAQVWTLLEPKLTAKIT
jgi:hypothetical protein